LCQLQLHYGQFQSKNKMSNATSTNYFTTILQNVDVVNFLLVFI